MRTKNKYILGLWSVVQVELWLFSTGCANKGIGPQGGPKDTIPPVITKMSVPNGARNVKDKSISIQFNEFILLEGSTDNIMISPPQQRPPEIKAVGKKIEIEFQEDLKDSTTYTIDFGNQIVDNNEKNSYKDFTYSFSTGNQIDSLEIYGQLINAADLNPISGVIIGLQEDLTDSAFSGKPFTRIGRTNTEGEFSIKNIKAGSYRLYALMEQSKDYCYQPGEGLAFQEELVTPYINVRTETDTIYLKDTLDADGHAIPDSVITAEYYYYEPSELLLRFFKEDRQRHYFQRALRKDAHCIQLIFGSPQDSMPRLIALRLEGDSLQQDSLWVDVMKHCIVQSNAKKDTISLWLTDSCAIRMDSIRLAMTYMKSDSLLNLVPQTDTILAIYRAPRINERTKKILEQKRLKTGLAIKTNASGKFNHFDTLCIQTPTPILQFEQDNMHLQIKKDTLWKDVAFQLALRDSTAMNLQIIADLRPNEEYQLLVDSGAIKDIYHMTSKTDKYSIKIRPKEDYATLTVFVSPFVDNAYIQLLNANDQPIRTLKAEKNGTLFSFIDPGIHYMRLFIDEDSNGKWTTGDWSKHRQPESVYYSHKKLNLRANWTFEETFDWQSIPLLLQKPSAIRKDMGTEKK
ncbi:MAG: Ig-like domain-containing protein [Paludibacteraceae bacterium]|nr:Ig-like domain-containing protein [Paludibacteraceae bacterium]